MKRSRSGDSKALRAGVAVPGSLEWLRDTAAGRAWLEALPDILAECEARWKLELGDVLPGGSVSLSLLVRSVRGSHAVLKVQFPHPESEHEASALVSYGGDGAVRLLGHDERRHALLLERCRPGTPLTERGPDVALRVAIELLPRLWRAADEPFRSASAAAAQWMAELPRAWMRTGRPFEQALLDTAIEALKEVSRSRGERVLLHQDLHPGNILRAEREPWLAIDPKPLVGERELGVAPLVRAPALGHDRRSLVRRLDALTRELGLDRERARCWALGQTLAWSFEGNQVLEQHVQAARWLVDAAP